MIVQLSTLALAASILSSSSFVAALSASEIPADTPISSLLSSANAHLARGETGDAISYYDVAISRDPNNYLTFFKRGATYLSLGRTSQAQADFDKVLSIKPGFEGALLQRAKIKSRNGEWDAAKKDYELAGKAGGKEFIELDEAQGAASLAAVAEKNGNWEECVSQAGVAIMVASKMLALRYTRSHCRFEKGEMQEGISDLMHVLQMQPGLTEPHIKISSILYYAMGDAERGIAQIKKCLHSDPDSKSCKKLHKQEKATEKVLARVRKSIEKRQFSSAVKPLVPTADGDEVGLIQEIKDEVQALREAGIIPALAPNELISSLVELACESYSEMGSKKAAAMCVEALKSNENSKWGLITQAQKHFDADNFEAAVHTLEKADEHHQNDNTVKDRLHKAHVALKRSKEKDYYKILGVAQDADIRQIKSAYRKATQKHHPDKSQQSGISKEDAEKKMAGINEAYEVLSDPEMRERFDRGDDPNSHEGHQQPFHGNPFGGQPIFHHGGSHHFKFNGFPGGGGGNPFGF